MSATAGAWLVLAAGLTLLAARRPAYAVGFYMLTFFAAPHLWWWGDDVPDLRYAVIAGFLLIGSIIVYLAQSPDDHRHRWSLVHGAAAGMALNATLVHFALASVPSISVDNYAEFLKYILLFFLLWRAINTREDLRIVILSIALGAAYIGYEVWWNERGYFSGSRLEGVGAPAADSSNSLASLMLLTLPLIGTLFVRGNWRHKAAAMVAGPLALNVVVLCNSRGAFLALIGSGVTFLGLARGATRKQAVKSLALGGLALFLLLGDPEILDRFSTTFAGSEERDRSAASRIEFWKAGLLMLSDYPLGDGGGSFKYVHGDRYIARVVGEDWGDRSLHNGFLTEATEWGIQGLVLRLVFITAGLLAAYRTYKLCRLTGRTEDALIGLCLIAALAGFLITSMFGSFLRNEWGFWIMALLVRYGDLYGLPEAVADTQAESVTSDAPLEAPWTARRAPS